MPNHRPCRCPHIAPYPPYAIRNVIVTGMVTTAIAMSWYASESAKGIAAIYLIIMPGEVEFYFLMWNIFLISLPPSLHSFSNSRCASCIGESARAQWFRHSDGWRSGSSTIGSGSGHGMMTQQVPGSGHKRSPWDSLPSLRQDSSLNDSGYKSARADSLEQR